MGEYPSESELTQLREWPADDPVGWFATAKGAWWAADWGWHEEDATDHLERGVRRFSISTAGWSGNEDIIHAMSDNILWSLTWESSRRGGHYVFELPEGLT